MPGVLHVGACEVDLSARELRVDGQAQSVEPRVFALLACLAERRDRVVTKQELLDTVWSDRPVSDGALARTVMKARQAIGDTGEPPLIRTVPRVGYRLVAPRDASPVDAPAPAAPLRVALLPFDNRLDDAAFDWVGVGLMSLVIHSLGEDRRVCVVPAASVIGAVEGARAAGADPVENVRAATGAQVVIGARVSRVHEEYELALEGPGVGGETMRARDLGEFGPRAAAAIRAGLLHDAGAKGAGPTDFADPLAMTAFARSLQALARQRYAQAANLLRMTLALAPGNPAVELELLRALCGLADLQGSAAIADRLLAEAARRGDAVLAARVHFALARGHMPQSMLEAAAHHVEAGLQALGDDAAPDELALGHLLRAKIASIASDLPKVEQSLERMRNACERSGDRLLPIARLTVLANMADARGDYPRAAELNCEAAHAARRVHAHREMVSAEGNAAGCFMMLGRWSEAAEHAEQAFAAALLMNDPFVTFVAALHGTVLYLVIGVPAAAQRIVQALPQEQELPPMARHWALVVHGNHAACAGDHEAAARLYGQARQGMHEAGNRLNANEVLPWLLYALVRCGRLDEADAELAAALPPGAPSGHDPALRQLIHCQAQVAHARGRSAQALEILLGMLQGETVPLWRAWAALDAAWLHAEAGRGAQALALLPLLPPEIAAHPLTHAVAARAHHAAGDADAALRHHRRYLDAAGSGCAHPFLAGLGACYADRAVAVPKAPGLPSRL